MEGDHRGDGEETPHKGDECVVRFKVTNARTRELYQEAPEKV